MTLNEQQMRALVKLLGGMKRADMERLRMSQFERALLAGVYWIADYELCRPQCQRDSA